MKALILTVFPIALFVLGFLVGRLNRKPSDQKWTEAQLQVARARLFRQDELIDDLGWMAADHQALGDPFAVLAMEKIQKFHKTEREKGA